MSEIISMRVDERSVQSVMARLAAKVENRSELMRDIAAAMKSAVQENFIREGRPERWAPSKRAKREGGQTLRDSGRLFRSITEAYDNNSARVGTNVRYAPYLQFGTKPRVITATKAKALRIPGIGFRKSVRNPGMPARPFMVLTDHDLRRIVDKVEQFLKSAKF